MQNFWIIFTQELLISSRNFGRILANFLFFVISVFVFFLIAQNQENQQSTAFYSITIIWFSLLSCLIFSASEFLKKDFDDGTIEQVLRATPNFEIFVLAKMLANWLINIWPILLATLAISGAIGLDKNLIKNFLLLLFFASLAINFICTFCGSLSALENSAPLIGVLAFPLIIPILLIAYGGVAQNDLSALSILLGLSVFIGVIATFASAKIIRIAGE